MKGQSDPKNRQDNEAHHKPRLDEYSESERDNGKYGGDEECAYSSKSPVVHFIFFLIARSSNQISQSIPYIPSHSPKSMCVLSREKPITRVGL